MVSRNIGLVVYDLNAFDGRLSGAEIIPADIKCSVAGRYGKFRIVRIGKSGLTIPRILKPKFVDPILVQG